MSIKKLIFYTCFEICLFITIILSTYFIWNTFNLEESAKIAYSYDNNIEKLLVNTENKIQELIPTKEENIKEENNLIKVEITNNSIMDKKYDIYIKVNKKTTLNTEYLKILNNEKVLKLSDLNKTLREDYIYYYLKTDTIKTKTNIIENIYLSLDEYTPNSEQGKMLDLEIFIEEINL